VIYFNDNDLAFNVPYKENIQVFLNGILITYNNYDYVFFKDYVTGIEFNNNIYKFKSTDIITILYIKVGYYRGNSNIVSDSYNISSVTKFFEKDFFMPKKGFKLLGNIPGLPANELYKIEPGILNNTNYVILGSLLDRSSNILTINMNYRNNKALDENELKYIDLMKNDGMIINIV
jgi:hypothetical protein